MTTLSEYVSDQLEAAVSRSDLSACQVVGWDRQATEQWAVAWRPLTLDVEGTLGNHASNYSVGIQIVGNAADTEAFEKHCMTPSAQGSLIGEIAQIGWVFSDWDFANEDLDEAGIKLGASCVATLPSVAEFRDDGINYIETEIIFWDIDNNEPYTDEVVIDYKPTGDDGSVHRIELIDGKRPLGVLNSGGYDVVVAGGSDEPRLWTLAIDERLEQVDYDGRTWDLWRLSAVFKDDVLVHHTGDDSARTSGSFGINIVPQFVAPNNFYQFANETLEWSWRNQVPEGTTESEILLYTYSEEPVADGSVMEFEADRSVARNNQNAWQYVEDTNLDDILVVRPTGGFHRTIQVEFLPASRLGVVAVEEEGYDYADSYGQDDAGEDWYAFEFGANNNAIRLGNDSVGDTFEGTLRFSVPNETIDGVTYTATSAELSWRLTIRA